MTDTTTAGRRRFGVFCLVGAVGTTVNMTWNFAPNVRWTWRGTCARAAAAVTAAAVVVLTCGVSAFAAGYSNTIPITAPPGAFTTVLISATLSANTPADLVSGPIELQVPANALPAGTQITVFEGDQAELQALLPSGWRYIDGYAVGWLAPDGTSPPATASLILKIADSRISSNDAAYSTTTSGLVPATAASITSGSASFAFTTDPGFVLASPAAPPPVPTTGTAPIPSLVPASLLGIAAALIASAFAFRRRSG